MEKDHGSASADVWCVKCLYQPSEGLDPRPRKAGGTFILEQFEMIDRQLTDTTARVITCLVDNSEVFPESRRRVMKVWLQSD